MTPDQILDRAADVIDRDGFWNSTDGIPLYDRPRAACALIAIDRVLKLDASNEAAETALIIMERHVGGPLPQWNDANDKETVTSTLRAVAATLRAQADKSPAVVSEAVTA